MILFLFNAHTFVPLIKSHFLLLSSALFHRTRPLFFFHLIRRLAFSSGNASLFHPFHFARSIGNSLLFLPLSDELTHSSRSLCFLLFPSPGYIIFTPFSRSLHRQTFLSLCFSVSFVLAYSSIQFVPPPHWLCHLSRHLSRSHSRSHPLFAYRFSSSLFVRPLFVCFFLHCRQSTSTRATQLLRSRRVSVDRQSVNSRFNRGGGGPIDFYDVSKFSMRILHRN